jgi:hypothetical protein
VALRSCGYELRSAFPHFGDVKNAKFTKEEVIHGWRVGWEPQYEETVMIECTCGHLSVRERHEIQSHVCPSCGRTTE